jgi:hypothetical protein
VELRLAEAGVPPAQLSDLARLEEGLGIADDSGSWASSVETIVRGWLRDGRVDEAERAVAIYAGAPTPVAIPLRDASIALCRAWLLQAQGREAEAVGQAGTAVRLAMDADAPWWLFRALEVEDDPATRDRRREMRTSLGVVIDPGVRPVQPTGDGRWSATS